LKLFFYFFLIFRHWKNSLIGEYDLENMLFFAEMTLKGLENTSKNLENYFDDML